MDMRASLAKNCAVKQQEYDERNKLQKQEMEAIGETITMLNSDDALELFKKTLPSASSFIQISLTSRSKLRRALLSGHHVKSHHSMLVALQSSTGGFEKVAAMVDGMVGVLESEQASDDKQDAWCLAELDKAEAEAKAAETDLGDVQAKVEEEQGAVEAITEQIAQLKEGLVELDKNVAEATEQRKKEHQEYIDCSTANQAAVDLLGQAKNRMAKFYNPAMYKEPPKENEEFFAQVAMHTAVARPDAGSFLQYRKAEGGGGVIQMMDQMIKDAELDAAEAKHEEEQSQKDYEEDMMEAKLKREDDSKLIVSQESEKSEKVSALEDFKEQKRSKTGALDILKAKIDNLHKTCDALVEHYAAIKEERKKEEEGLKASKMVLAGAKVGFLQQR